MSDVDAALQSGAGRSRIISVVARHPLSVFFCLAYVLAWAVTVPMVAFEGPIELTVLASFGPTVAALVTHRIATGSYRAFRDLAAPRHLLAGAVAGIALVILAYVVLPAVATADPRALKWGILASLGVYSTSTLLGGPLGEEPGWRGYALPQMEARFGPALATLLLAVLCAGWHAPLFLYPGWTSTTPWTYVLILLGVSVILTLGTNLARFSIVAPIAIHAIFNTVSRFLAGLFAESQPVVQISFTVVMALSGAVVAGLLLLATKGWLGYPGGRRAGV